MSVVTLVGGAVLFGEHIAQDRTLPGLSGRASADSYARNAIGKLAPINAKFTERRIGRNALRRPGALSTDAPRPSGTTTRPKTTPPPSTIRGKPGTFPTLTPGGWVLSIQMASDRRTAKSGEDVRYRMTVTNTGDEDFRGRSFRLEWHTPNDTVGRNPIGQCELAPAMVLELCSGQRLLFSPGLGEARHETFDSSGLIVIRPRSHWAHDWYVRVLPSAAVGTQFLNHSHLTVTIDGKDVRITSNDVVVTVE